MMESYQLPNVDFELMAANLTHLQHAITEEDEQQSSIKSSPAKGETQKSEQWAIRERYQEYLCKRNLPEDHQQKICYLIEQQPTIGNAVALYQMLHYFKEALTLEILQQISEKAYGVVIKDSGLLQRAYGELLALAGGENQQICQTIAQMLLEQQISFQLGLAILVNQGQTGLIYLFDLANRDISGLSGKILDHLSRSETIVQHLIFPLLLEELQSPNPTKHKDVALAIINRLGNYTFPIGTADIFMDLLREPSVDKRLLFAAMRSLGFEGETKLLQIISSKRYSESLVALAISVLSWRVPNKGGLRLRAIQFTIQNCFLPGRLYQYEGKVDPWNFSEACTDSLCLSSRDFLAQLSLSLRQGAFRARQKTSCRQVLILQGVLRLEENQNSSISSEVVRVLAGQLKGKSTQLKQLSLLELGNIGAPEASPAESSVGRCLWDSDCTIRSAACWGLSRICNRVSRKHQIRFSQLLRDNFWKVRTSACIAIGLTIEDPLPQTVEALIRTLQDGSIPKTTICQTLVRCGAEELLLQVLKGSSQGDFKLREAIISSFQFSSLREPIITSIVQQILRHSRDSRAETRQLCLLALNSLRCRAEAQNAVLSHLQTKTLLPFYYCFLQDSSPKIRALASEGILSFGAQAELIFIEGMTKGQSLTKIQCIRCLGRLGVQNFRALILGLRDSEEKVRKVAGQSILGNFTVDEIVEHFSCRENHSLSLLCSLKEVLNSGLKGQQLRSMLSEVVSGLEIARKTGKIRHKNQNVRINQ